MQLIQRINKKKQTLLTFQAAVLGNTVFVAIDVHVCDFRRSRMSCLSSIFGSMKASQETENVLIQDKQLPTVQGTSMCWY